eukprot:GSMAST32.ASY1.ANO1.2465.1 assembled CDS
MAKGRAEKRRKQAAQTAIDELNKDVSEIVDESEVNEEEECVGNRRSSRSRVSRYMQIDGQTVLKANNYTMEQGELSVYSPNKQRDEEWQKLNEKRKMSKAAKMKAQGKDRVFDLSTIEGRRLKHNKSMKAERESVIALRNTVFAYYRNNLKGFTENIPHALSTSEYDVMTAGLVDTEGAPCVSQPSIIVNGTMRNYQLKSLEWLLWMYVRKTLQTIAYLAALKERGVCGPHVRFHYEFLIVMSSWMSEFRRWCPSLRVVRLHSQDKHERMRLRTFSKLKFNYDVIVTTYDYVKVKEMRHTLSSRIAWRCLVLDEGHKLKNDEAEISLAMRRVNCQSILLLTGTPLQNNLHELWSLLNFLYPKIFPESIAFDDAFNVLSRAHHLMVPLMLRRVKHEVETMLPPRVETIIKCPLSEMQNFWYKQRQILKEKGENVGQNSGGEWKKLKSLMMQLRKCCNHPFLFPNVENTLADADELINEDASGKMENLDRLLTGLFANGHHIVDDYLQLQFNKPNSPLVAFIMSTKAGGLGVNLQTADTVILLDSDWNPQNDLQAMARVHRIGQTKLCHVYRMVSSGTMEERIVQRAQKKLFLDTMVNPVEKLGSKELLEALSFGVERLFDKKNDNDSLEKDRYLSESEVASIIDRSKTKESVKISVNNEDDNTNDVSEIAPMTKLTFFQGQDFRAGGVATYKDMADAWVEELKSKRKARERKSRYMQIDGQTVLKANNYTMNQGEPSVFHQENRKNKDEQVAIVAQTDNMKFQWYAAAVGGLIFRCEVCPTSYCEDHLPDIARNNITNKCKRFQNLGQNHPKQACFVLCSEKCQIFHKATNGGSNLSIFNTLENKEKAMRNAERDLKKEKQKKTRDALAWHKTKSDERKQWYGNSTSDKFDSTNSKNKSSESSLIKTEENTECYKKTRSKSLLNENRWFKGMRLKVDYMGRQYSAKVVRTSKTALYVKYSDGSQEDILWEDVEERVIKVPVKKKSENVILPPQDEIKNEDNQINFILPPQDEIKNEDNQISIHDL